MERWSPRLSRLRGRRWSSPAIRLAREAGAPIDDTHSTPVLVATFRRAARARCGAFADERRGVAMTCVVGVRTRNALQPRGSTREQCRAHVPVRNDGEAMFVRLGHERITALFTPARHRRLPSQYARALRVRRWVARHWWRRRRPSIDPFERGASTHGVAIVRDRSVRDIVTRAIVCSLSRWSDILTIRRL